MKKLITAADVKKAAETKADTLYIEPGTIITPAARDTACECNIKIVEGLVKPDKILEPAPMGGSECKLDVTAELIAKIVEKVIASLPSSLNPSEVIKEADTSGLRLVRGKSVVCEKFNTGKPYEKVSIKKILTKKESPYMTTGFMTMEKTEFSRDLSREEICYVIEGTLEAGVNGSVYRAEAGDVFYLPGETTIKFSSPGRVKLFFVTNSYN